MGIDGTEPPSAMDNLKWLFGYQFNWMYWRYFMWNFVGRQNDLQGTGNPRDGNWISGIGTDRQLATGRPKYAAGFSKTK